MRGLCETARPARPFARPRQDDGCAAVRGLLSRKGRGVGLFPLQPLNRVLGLVAVAAFDVGAQGGD